MYVLAAVTVIADTFPSGLQPQMTLDEWEARQKEKRVAKAKPAVQANKEDFANMTAFTRKDRTADEEVLRLSNQKAAPSKAQRERKGVRLSRPALHLCLADREQHCVLA